MIKLIASQRDKLVSCGFDPLTFALMSTLPSGISSAIIKQFYNVHLNNNLLNVYVTKPLTCPLTLTVPVFGEMFILLTVIGPFGAAIRASV